MIMAGIGVREDEVIMAVWYAPSHLDKALEVERHVVSLKLIRHRHEVNLTS